MKECISCEWMTEFVDNMGRTIYFCVNTESEAYLKETGLCGNCGLLQEAQP